MAAAARPPPGADRRRTAPLDRHVGPPAKRKRKPARAAAPRGAPDRDRPLGVAGLMRRIAEVTPAPRTSTIWTERQRRPAMAEAARKVLKVAERHQRAAKAMAIPALWKNVGKFDPRSACGPTDLATARELISNLDNAAEMRGWTEHDRATALGETLRGEAGEWWDSEEASAVRRQGWSATSGAILERYGPGPGYRGDDVERIQNIPKPPGWGRVSTVMGNCELHYAPAAMEPATRCPVAGGRPWLKVRPHSRAGDPTADIDFLVDSGTQWSTVTSATLAELRAAGSVHGSMVYSQPGEETVHLFVLHVCVANAGILALRAVIADDRRCSVGLEDMGLFEISYSSSDDGGMISIGFLEKRFYAAFEVPAGATGEQDLQ